MSTKKSFWIPLAGSVALLLLLVLVILSADGAPSLAADSPVAPADVAASDSWTWSGPSYDTASGYAPMTTDIVIDPSSPYTVYAGTNQGVYRSTNAGSTWEAANGGLGGYGDLVVADVEIDLNSTNHQKLIIGTWGYGVFQSLDGGLNWTRLADPLATADPQPSGALDPAGLGPDAPQVRVGGVPHTRPVDASDRLKQPLPAGVVVPQQQIADGEQIESPQALPGNLPWTPVRDVAIHPTNSNQLFACIEWGGGGGLHISNNGGASWFPAGVGTAYCRTITFAPSNSLIRYASFGTWGVSDGFYRTTNGGVSWTEVGSPEIGGTVIAVAIHPTDSNIVLAGTSDDGLFRSANGGETWTRVSDTSSLDDDDYYSVAFAPGNGNIAYAGGDWWVYRSGDAGATWANADPSFPTYYIEGLAIHPTSASTVLVGSNEFFYYYIPYTEWPSGGVYKRTSDGSAFALAASGMSDTFVLELEQDPILSNVLYAATWGGGVFRSDNGGLTWNHQFGVPYITCLEATVGPEGTVLYAGTFYRANWGVLKSLDRGDSWDLVSSGYSTDESFEIMSLDGEDQNLVAATAEGVEYSTNGGVSWINASGLTQGVVLGLAQSPNDPNRLLAATYGGGVWSSGSGGTSWSESSTGLGSQYVYDVAYSAPPFNTAYAATLGVYRSENGGASWFLSGLPSTYVRALDTLGGPGYDAFAGTHNRGVYMAPQRTNWWMDLNAGLGEHRTRALLTTDYDTLFVGTNGRGAWEYTLVNRPRPEVSLPVVMKNYVGTSPTPETVTLNPLADATVLSGYPDLNLGDVIDMWVGYDFDECYAGHTARSMAKFDLSPIPSGSSIQEATLSLYLVSSCDYDNRYHATTIYRIPQNWSSSTVTWYTQPSYAESYGTTYVGSRTWGRYGFDVQGLVQGWVNGAFPNYGLMIRGPESSSSGARLGFATMEEDGTYYDPYIEVTWVSGDGAQGTAILPAVGVPESDGQGPAIGEILPPCSSTEGEGLPGYEVQTAPED